jgi:hypothetical protein
MASNPFPSARESLITMFDENRKKVNKNFYYLRIEFKIYLNYIFNNILVLCH